MLWYFVLLLCGSNTCNLECIYPTHPGDLGGYNLARSVVGIQVEVFRAQIESWEVCFNPRCLWAQVLSETWAFQPLVGWFVGTGSVSQNFTVWLQHFWNGFSNFQMFMFKCKESDYTSHSTVVAGNPNCPDETKPSERGEFKALWKILPMRSNATSELVQFCSQIIKQYINSFLDCSFGKFILDYAWVFLHSLH